MAGVCAEGSRLRRCRLRRLCKRRDPRPDLAARVGTQNPGGRRSAERPLPLSSGAGPAARLRYRVRAAARTIGMLNALEREASVARVAWRGLADRVSDRGGGDGRGGACRASSASKRWLVREWEAVPVPDARQNATSPSLGVKAGSTALAIPALATSRDDPAAALVDRRVDAQRTPGLCSGLGARPSGAARVFAGAGRRCAGPRRPPRAGLPAQWRPRPARRRRRLATAIAAMVAPPASLTAA